VVEIQEKVETLMEEFEALNALLDSLEGEGYGTKQDNDQLSLSSHESTCAWDFRFEEKCDEVIEDSIATLHEDLDVENSIEDYAFHLVPEEISHDDDVHEVIPAAIIMDSKEDKVW
jgi:hypothetical protein